MNKSTRIFIFLIVGISSISFSKAQKTTEQIIRQYFKAFNASDIQSLNKVMTDDFTMLEGDFEICTNKAQFQTVFKWDSIFKPSYVVESIQADKNGAEVVVAKTDVRVRFLHDRPMVSKMRIEIENQAIKSLVAYDYKFFDTSKWQERLKGITSWVAKHHPHLNGFARDITPRGSSNYMKAIELYRKRKLTEKEKIFIDKDLQLVHLKDSILVHVCWHTSKKYGRFSSNGLIIVKDKEAIMVDTPFTNEETERLYDYLKNNMGVKVTHHIAGHFHADCMGGIKFLHQQGVHSIASQLTFEKCLSSGLPLPNESFEERKEFSFNGLSVECRFFGGGHSFDNITVWMPHSKVLFGGCMVKNYKAQNMGNLSDAVVKDWDSTVTKVQNAYPQAKYVIPGHGAYGGGELLTHTIKLVKNYKLKNGIK